MKIAQREKNSTTPLQRAARIPPPKPGPRIPDPGSRIPDHGSRDPGASSHLPLAVRYSPFRTGNLKRLPGNWQITKQIVVTITRRERIERALAGAGGPSAN